MKKTVITKYPYLLHGGDYNPDQWLDHPEVLEEDIELMKKAHINCVSLGIFAWAKLEPEEGKYEFDWMEQIIDRLCQNGIYTVLATPSGAMPNWLTARYEEALQVSETGVRNVPGKRHNFCFSSPLVRKKVKEINGRLAARFGKNPAVILWHISNEYGGNGRDASCHCPLCQQAFREWLQEKYGSLENLNNAWWTAFWSHTYTDWQQIHSPVPNGESRLHGLTLDWKRFVSHQIQDFCEQEIRAVREFSDIPVTTNMMQYFEPLDYPKFADSLDVISWDCYPSWHSEKDEVDVAVWTAALHNMFRSMKKAPFLMMESTPSIVNWKSSNTQKRPGMHELASMQAIAHGSDSVQYFQWRKGRGSFEKFHGAVVDHRNGENTRVFKEVASLGTRMEKLSDEILGTCNRPETAIVFDWENWWALEDAAGPRQEMRYVDTILSHYKPFWEMGIDVDIVDMDAVFRDYKLVIAPLNYMYKPGYPEKIREFVAKGGCYVTTYFSGVVNETDLCFTKKSPLEDVLGIRVEEIDCVSQGFLNRITFKDHEYDVKDLREVIHLNGAEARAVYESDYYKGSPAVTKNVYGNGEAWYIASENEPKFLAKFYKYQVKRTKTAAEFTGKLPYGVTACKRDGKKPVWFIQNFNGGEVKMRLDKTYHCLPDGEKLEGEIFLKPYECLVLR